MVFIDSLTLTVVTKQNKSSEKIGYVSCFHKIALNSPYSWLIYTPHRKLKPKMFFKTVFRQALTYSMFRTVKKTNFSLRRNLHQSSYYCANNKDGQQSTALTLSKHFEQIQNKNKNTYLEMIQMFVSNDSVYRRGHVEFIYAALRHMESFGVQRDLEVYKSLIDIMPKGKFIPTNLLQVEFMHYPKQQQCIIDLLEQMEDNGKHINYIYRISSVVLGRCHAWLWNGGYAN